MTFNINAIPYDLANYVFDGTLSLSQSGIGFLTETMAQRSDRMAKEWRINKRFGKCLNELNDCGKERNSIWSSDNSDESSFVYYLEESLRKVGFKMRIYWTVNRIVCTNVCNALTHCNNFARNHSLLRINFSFGNEIKVKK